jgi:hypothetical protein
MRKVLFAADIVLLVLLSVAWAVSEVVGYSARLTVHRRALVVDVVMGEVALWTGPVSARYSPVTAAATTRPIALIPPVADPDLYKRFDQLVYERGAAFTTDQWFASARRDPTLNVWGVFALGLGYGQAKELYFAPPLKRGAMGHVFVLPFWLFVGLLLIAPVRNAIRWRRGDQAQRWRAAGRCFNCGYDLRATPDRCPECGAASSDYTVRA